MYYLTDGDTVLKTNSIVSVPVTIIYTEPQVQSCVSKPHDFHLTGGDIFFTTLPKGGSTVSNI